MSRTKFFRKVFDGTPEGQRLQKNIEDAVAQTLRSPILDNVLFENQNLISGTTALEHKLARVPRGYVVVDRSNASTIYTASKDDKFLNLVSSGAVTVSILIF